MLVTWLACAVAARQLLGRGHALRPLACAAAPTSKCFGCAGDTTFEYNCSNIQYDLNEALALVVAGQYCRIVLPSAGLGTGVAALPLEAPRTHAFLVAAVRQLCDTLDTVSAT